MGNPAPLEKPTAPLWLEEFSRQIKPGNWCIPVEDVWRKYGWVPPSRECPATMRKHETYRRWIPVEHPQP